MVVKIYCEKNYAQGIFQACLYRVHRAVIFGIAQLSCSIFFHPPPLKFSFSQRRLLYQTQNMFVVILMDNCRPAVGQ